MSRILRRPMFRKGGSVEKGIGSMMPRKKYQEAGFVEEIMKEAGPDTTMDPLTKFLLSYGPALATQRPTGGLLGTLTAAAKEPTQQLLTDVAEREKFLRNLRVGAKQAELEQRGKEKLLEKEIEAQKEIAGMKIKAEDLKKVEGLASEYLKSYDDWNMATNRAKYDLGIRGEIAGKVGESQVGGIIDVDLTDPKQAKTFANQNQNKIGKYFYDISTGETKQLIKSPEGTLGFKTVSLDELDTEGVGQPTIEKPVEKKKEIKPGTTPPSGYLRESKPREKDIPGYIDITGA